MKMVCRVLVALSLMVGALQACAQVPEAPQGSLDDKMGLTQNLGAQVPLDLTFRQEDGKTVKLKELFRGKPVLLVPVFYNCKGSCLLVRDGVVKVLNLQKKLKVGEDFDVIVFSIHPKETPELAKAAKDYWVKNYKVRGTEEGWHFLTSDYPTILSLTQSIGFKFWYDEKKDLIAHPAAIMMLTDEGYISHYFFGVSYAAKELLTATTDAKEGKIGGRAEEILFGCMQYDPATGQYRLMIENVVRVLGVVTLVILACSIAIMSFKHRRPPIYSLSDTNDSDTHRS